MRGSHDNVSRQWHLVSTYERMVHYCMTSLPALVFDFCLLYLPWSISQQLCRPQKIPLKMHDNSHEISLLNNSPGECSDF